MAGTVPPVPAGQVLGHRRERGIDPAVSGALGALAHIRAAAETPACRSTLV